jgi:hypothetical protein
MLEDTAMGMDIRTWNEANNEVFMTQANQLSQVTDLCMRTFEVPRHALSYHEALDEHNHP